MAEKTARINLRISPEDLEVIDAAAEDRGQDRSSFIIETASREARWYLTERTRIVLDPEAWDDLMAMLDRPPRADPRLQKLFRENPA